jgi:hypothetical protein
MRIRTHFCRFVALAAAYVVALQALLLPLSVAINASFISSPCATSVENSHPISHETGCPCATGCGMQCCDQTLASPPRVEAAPAQTYARVTTSAPALEVTVRPPAKGLQVARAPPAV